MMKNFWGHKNLKGLGKLPLAFCLAIALILPLSGCALDVPTDTGGIASAPTETPENKVNPSQDADSSFLYDTSISELQSSSANILDGQTLQIEGEVIGDMRHVDFDDSHYWITLQSKEKDKYNTITVYCSSVTTSMIDTYGAYGRRGTTLQIRGVFHIACPDHDGLPDFHAESTSVKAKGNTVNPPFSPDGLTIGIMMLLVGGVMIATYAVMAKKTKADREEIDDEDDE